MATGAWVYPNASRGKFFNGTFDVDSDSYKVILLTSASNIGLSSTTYAGVTGEVAQANGYTTGGQPITFQITGAQTITITAATLPSWHGTTGSIIAKYAAVIEDGGDVMCYCLLNANGTDVVVVELGATYTLVPQPFLQVGPEGAGPGPDPEPEPDDFEWTSFTESVDTIKVYVSNSVGLDSNSGLTEALPKKTLTAGKNLLRSGFPDWLLLKAGDTWTNEAFGSWTKSGRSASEPMLVSSYGTGERPYVKTGTANGFQIFSTTVNNLSIVGIKLHAHTRVGTEGDAAIFWLRPGDNILVEDCFIEGFNDNLLFQADDGDGTITDVSIRGCIIVDSFSTDASHSQGLFASGVNGLTVERCTFDQNGWAGNDAIATVFNHNSYITDCANVTLDGNIYLRACSIGNKFAANAVGAVSNVLVENNFYIEGEIGLSIGGNEELDLRFINVILRNNVLYAIGRDPHAGRNISWGIDVQDWDGTLIESNILSTFTVNTNSLGIEFTGQSERNVTVQNNILYKINTSNLIMQVTGSITGITVTSNHFQDATQSSKMVQHSGAFAAVTYIGNSYFTNITAANWFSTPSGSNRSYAQWVTDSSETGSTNVAVTYPDPARSETTYMTSIGETATFAAFIAGCRANSKANWDSRFTAPAINTYFRAGFGV